MPDENELGTQPSAEGVTAEIPGNETAPEQTNSEQHADTGQGNEGGKTQAAAATETTGEAKPEKPKPTFYEKRFGELTFEKREAQRKLDAALAELAALKSGKPAESVEAAPTPDPAPLLNSDDAVERRAAQLLEARAFAERVNSVITAGNKEFDVPTFTQKSNLVAGIAGERAGALMSIVADPEIVTDGHKLIAALAHEPDAPERMLALPPTTMTLATVAIT